MKKFRDALLVFGLIVAVGATLAAIAAFYHDHQPPSSAAVSPAIGSGAMANIKTATSPAPSLNDTSQPLRDN